jgi:hypothetical protein
VAEIDAEIIIWPWYEDFMPEAGALNHRRNPEKAD